MASSTTTNSASEQLDVVPQFQTPIKKKKCPSPITSASSPSLSTTSSSNTKQRSITDGSNHDETITTIKMEDGLDEVKVYAASTVAKNEPEDDVDVDGIEDRLSPVVEEPTSPTKNDPFGSGISGLYASPFLYPYFHPMFHPYLMAAAAQANVAASSGTDKSSLGGPNGNPYGGGPLPGLHPGMSFSSLYPPGMVNQSFRPNLFNPFGIPIPTPGVRPPPPPSSSSSASSSNHHHRHQHQHPSYDGSSRSLSALLDSQKPKKPHIKKPLNAFMLYMKEQRARVIEECTLKESSAINKVLGQKWKELPRSEQDKYYELAKEERNRHMQMYPGWSARENYGIRKKRQAIRSTSPSHKKQQPRPNNSMVNSPAHSNPHSLNGNHGQSHGFSNSPHHHHNTSVNKPHIQLDNDCLNQKKCRARFGLEGQGQWCKHCRRKKKCTRFLEDDMNSAMMNGHYGSSVNTPGGGSNGDPSSLSSPGTGRSDNEHEDSMQEPDGDDILSRQLDSIEDDDDDDDDNDDNNHHHHLPTDDDSDEENKQQHHPMPLVFKPQPFKLDQQQSQTHSMHLPPPPAHRYQPSSTSAGSLPTYLATPGFHY